MRLGIALLGRLRRIALHIGKDFLAVLLSTRVIASILELREILLAQVLERFLDDGRILRMAPRSGAHRADYHEKTFFQ